jgi:hypothetical protein
VNCESDCVDYYTWGIGTQSDGTYIQKHNNPSFQQKCFNGGCYI